MLSDYVIYLSISAFVGLIVFNLTRAHYEGNTVYFGGTIVGKRIIEAELQCYNRYFLTVQYKKWSNGKHLLTSKEIEVKEDLFKVAKIDQTMYIR